MKQIISIFILFVLGVVATAQTKKAVFIIVDGVPADVIARVATPAIDQIAAQGGYAVAETGGLAGGYSETPTISAVGYNNLLTATWANKHNVWGNDISAPNYNYWNIFRIAESQKKALKSAVFSGWIDNRTKLIGEGLPEAGAIKVDFVLDGLDLDTINYPREPKDMHIFKIDEKVTDAAATCIAEQAPDLTWLYLWYMDDAGHITGTGDYFDDYLKKADQQIERVWNAVKEREKKYNEKWMIVVTSDHGRTAPDGHGHGGQTPRERSIWISTNVKPNAYFTASGMKNITDITPSICGFMGWSVPDAVRYEWDGIPFVGKVDLANVAAQRAGNKITLNWDSFSNTALKVYVSTTNQFKEGGADEWVEVGTVKCGTNQFVYDTSNNPSTFYKFSLRGANNSASVWVTK